MAGQTTISQRGPDGTVEAWFDGWYVRFPPKDEPPTAERASPPASLQHPSAKLEATPFASGSAVQHGPWIVAVTESESTTIPADPEENDGDHRQFFRI